MKKLKVDEAQPREDGITARSLLITDEMAADEAIHVPNTQKKMQIVINEEILDEED